MNGKVKKGFLWGSANAAYQCEGAWNEDGKGESNWDQFCHSEKNKKGITGDVSADFYHHFKEDIGLFGKGGQNSYRFSLSWSRILPDRDGKINEAGIRFYKNVLDECKKNGITPNVTLLHYDIPSWLEDEGGYRNPEFSDAFAYYAKVVFENFGEDIPLYVTINEITHNTNCSYMTGNYPPNVHDIQAVCEVGYNLIIAHAKAVKEFRKFGFRNSQIGIVHTTNCVQTLKDSEEYRVAKRRCDLFKNKWVTDPCILGHFPEDLRPLLEESGIDLSFVKKEDLELLSETRIDFLGQNCYTRALARPWKEEDGETNYYPNNGGSSQKTLEGYVIKNWFTTDVDPSTRKNAWGREEYPKTVYDMLMGIRKDYGDIPVYITENGCARYECPDENSEINDQERIDFMKSYLDWLIKAENEGCNVKGYYAWSSTDCYSWINGYEKRYGLIYVDFSDPQRRRIPKKSYYWYRDYIVEHTEDA